MRPRRSRWLSVGDVLPRLIDAYPKFAKKIEGKSRDYQLRAVHRLVRKAEKLHECRVSKRVGRALYVSVDALESLVPERVDVLTTVEKNLADLHESHRDLVKRVNGHGSELRRHGQQLNNLTEKQRETTRYLAKMSALDAE